MQHCVYVDFSTERNAVITQTLKVSITRADSKRMLGYIMSAINNSSALLHGVNK